jgi:hypothetical protein
MLFIFKEMEVKGPPWFVFSVKAIRMIKRQMMKRMDMQNTWQGYEICSKFCSDYLKRRSLFGNIGLDIRTWNIEIYLSNSV